MHDSLILCLSRRCVKRSDGQSPRTFNLKETHLQMVTFDLCKSCYYWSHGNEDACSFPCFSIYYAILLRYGWCTIKYTYWCIILWVLTCIHSWTHHCNRGNENIHYSSQILCPIVIRLCSIPSPWGKLSVTNLPVFCYKLAFLF